jgi:hypothetical protein
MWARIFQRFGKRLGKLTIGGVLILIAVAALLIVGIYRLLG